MSLQKTEEFNKNVVMVYAEDSSFTGYKALEESKINSIASQSSGLLNQLTTLNNKIQTTGDLYSTILVHQMDLNSQFDNVDVGGFAGADISGIKQILSDGIKTYPYSTSTISNYATSGVNGLALPQNNDRKELFVQNLDTGILYLKYGLDANASNFNFVLAANSSINAGDGGSLNDQSYVGNVSVSGLFTPIYISWERS